MPLDPQAKALMDQMAALGGPKIEDLSPADARKVMGSGFVVPPEVLEKPAKVENRKIPGWLVRFQCESTRPKAKDPFRSWSSITEADLSSATWIRTTRRAAT